MAKIRMGVIGVGGISKVHIGGIQRSPDAELVAICDRNPRTLSEKGELYGIPDENRYLDYVELLNSGKIDAVSICTPNHAHVEMAMRANELRIPFAVEKPVGISVDEVQALADAVRETGTPHMVCFSYRFKKAARFARWIVEQGLIGRVMSVNVQYMMQGLLPSLSAKRPYVWRNSKALAGGGVSADLAVHMLDLVRFLSGLGYEALCASTGIEVKARPDPVSGEMKTVDTDDYCNFLARMEQGATGIFHISKLCYGRFNYQHIEIYGEKGALLYTLDDDDWLEACIGEAYSKSLTFTKLRIPAEFHSDQMQSFFDRINNRADGLAAQLDDGLTAQKLVAAALLSDEQQQWISVKEAF